MPPKMTLHPRGPHAPWTQRTLFFSTVNFPYHDLADAALRMMDQEGERAVVLAWSPPNPAHSSQWFRIWFLNDHRELGSLLGASP